MPFSFFICISHIHTYTCARFIWNSVKCFLSNLFILPPFDTEAFFTTKFFFLLLPSASSYRISNMHFITVEYRITEQRKQQNMHVSSYKEWCLLFFTRKKKENTQYNIFRAQSMAYHLLYCERVESRKIIFSIHKFYIYITVCANESLSLPCWSVQFGLVSRYSDNFFFSLLL